MRGAAVAPALSASPEETLLKKQAFVASGPKPASKARLSVEDGAWARHAVILSEKVGSEAEIFGMIKELEEEKARVAIDRYMDGIMHMGF